ncbi:MAG: ABC transporter permease [Sneathiella sp.]|nr:ABC transporter permease [Sneathiella sp.]
MKAYALRRLLALIPTLLIASVIVFFVIRLIPGSVIDLMLSENDFSNDATSREQLIAALGLDTPLIYQYFKWIFGIIVHADFGRTLWQDTPVIDEIWARLPITFELGVVSMLFALIVSIPIGVYSAIRQETIGDYAGRTFSILALAIPSFWLGTLVVLLPSLWWGWSPPITIVPFTEAPWENIKTYIAPGMILGLSLSAVTMRMTRTMMLEVLRQDYIRTAWAKGLTEKIVVLRHALKNALIPVITIIGLQIPVLIGGTVIMEQIFVIPGMGQLLLESVSTRDYPIITGIFLIVGTGVALINLLIDLCYGFLDPKVRFDK